MGLLLVQEAIQAHWQAGRKVGKMIGFGEVVRGPRMPHVNGIPRRNDPGIECCSTFLHETTKTVSVLLVRLPPDRTDQNKRTNDQYCKSFSPETSSEARITSPLLPPLCLSLFCSFFSDDMRKINSKLSFHMDARLTAREVRAQAPVSTCLEAHVLMLLLGRGWDPDRGEHGVTMVS